MKLTPVNLEYIADDWRAGMNPEAAAASIVAGDRYRFTVLSPGLVRCEFAADGRFEDRASQVVWHRDFPDCDFELRREGGWLEIETAGLVLRYREGRSFSRRTLIGRIKSSGTPGRDWHYGKHDSRNLRGTRRTLDMVNGRAPLGKGLLSRSGWAWLDDSKSLVFDNDWPAPRRGEGSSRAGKTVDGYLFGYGCGYEAALKDWYRLSGATPMIPRAILGNWWSRYYEYSEESLKALIKRFEAEKIPLSVCIIDMDWHLVDIPKKYGSGWTGYTWNRELFPDPQGMLNWLHEQGLLTSLNLHPARGFRAYEEAYERAARAMGIDPATEEPVKFDAGDPKFWKTYFEEVHHPMENEGVDFWWLDWQQGRKSSMKGLDPLWMLNHLHFMDSGRPGKRLPPAGGASHRTKEESSGTSKPTPRPFTFSRYSGPGAHRYPIGFSGDSFSTWGSLKFQPEMTARASNIGYGWWSHDIGGHMFGRSDSELYARWVQYGVFSPIMRLHSTRHEMNRREPWRHDAEAAAAAADVMRLRHRLIPYIYTAARNNHTEGRTLVRPLYYSHPLEREAYRHNTVYWFGSELIAAPVVEKAGRPLRQARRRFWLPKGDWYDFATGIRFSGGMVRTRYYRLDEIPLFACAGAIVPLADGGELNGTGNPDAISFNIFPGANNRYVLYEDDGQSGDYADGCYSETVVDWKWTPRRAEADISFPPAADYLPRKRTVTIRLRNLRPDTTVNVEVNGTPAEADVRSCEAIGMHRGPALEVTLAAVTPNTRIHIRAEAADDANLERSGLEDSGRAHERAFDILDRADGSVLVKTCRWKRLDRQPDAAARWRHLKRQIFIPRRLRRALMEQYKETT